MKLKSLKLPLAVLALLMSAVAPAQLPGSQYDDYDLEKYQGQLQEERRQFKPLKDQLENSKNQHEQNQSKLQNAKAKLEQLRNQIQSSQAELKSTRDQLSGMEGQRKSLRQAIDAAKANLPGLQSSLQQVTAEVAQLEQQLGPYKGEIDRLVDGVRQAQQELNQAQNKVQQATQQLNKQVAEGQRIDGEIAEVKQKLAEIENKPDRPNKPSEPPAGGSGPNDEERGGRKKKLEERLQKLTERKAQNEGEIQAAQAQVSAAEGEASKAQNQVASAKSALDQLQAKVGDIQRRYTQALESKRSLAAQVQKLSEEIQTKQAQLEATKNQEDALKAKEQQLENQLAQLRGQLPGVEQELAQAQSQVEQSKNQLQAARQAVEQAKGEVDRAEAKLQQIQNNIEAARRHLENLGSQHGAADGQRGASQEAEQAGSAAGVDQGREDGTRDGQEEAVRRARAAGEAEGQRIGNEVGVQDGGRQGAIDGERDGRREGTAAGLKRAYKTGYDSGYANGLSTGGDSQAYQTGNARGMAQGLIDAVNEAKPLEKKSYDQTEAGYLNAPLKSINLGDDLVTNNFKGLQQRKAGDKRRGDRRGPRDGRRGHGHRDGGLPHPRLKQFYLAAYDNAFQSAFQDTYARVYDVEFDRAYQRSYNQYYGEYANQNRQDVYKQAYDSAYGSAYESGYRQRYSVVYANEKDNAYDVAFNANKNDAGKMAEGQTDGLRQGSFDKGYKDGRNTAYQANIEIEKQKAIAKGKKSADDYYQNNAVLSFGSVEVMEQDGDKFYRPGELVDVSISLKNFGLKAGQGYSEILKGNDVLAISEGEIATADLPAQSQIRIFRKGKIQVKPTAKDGSKAKLSFEMKNSDQVLARKNFEMTAQYVVELSVEGIQGTLAPGAKKKVKLTLKNRASTPQKVKMLFNIDGEILKTTVAAQSEIELKKNETKVINGEIQGLESGFLLKSPVDVVLMKGEIAWSVAHNGGITVAKKYTLNSKAKGILISSGQTAKGTSALYQSGGLDVWDYRVDTARMAGSTVEKYSGKIVQVLADRGLTLEIDVNQAIKKHYSRGGTVVIWGSEINESKEIQTMLNAWGIEAARSENFDGELLGSGAFSDLKLKLKSEIQPLVIKTVRGQSLLKAGDLSVMASHFQGAMKTQYSRVFVIGLNPADLGVKEVQKILARIESLGLDWNKKLTATKANVANLTLAFSDIRDEVVEAEVDEKSLYFKDFGRNNRIQRLIEQLLFAKSISAQLKDAVIGYYPYVQGLVNSLTKEKPFAEKVLLIKPDAKSKTWKDQYCLKFKDVEAAKEQVATFCK